MNGLCNWFLRCWYDDSVVFHHHQLRNPLSPFVNLYSEGDSGKLQAMMVWFAQKRVPRVPATGEPTLRETTLHLFFNLFNESYQVDRSHGEDRLEK